MKHQRIRKRICAWLLAIAMVVTGVNLPGNVMSVAAASNAKYEPLTVASGYNADIVATSTSSSSSEYYAKTAAMDNTGLASKGGCLYSYGANSSAGYLPADRIITSTATNGLTWKMAPYNGKNALKLTSESNYCELDFSTIGVYQKLYFLCTAGGLGTGNSGTMKAKITYTDGKIATSTFTVRDWWDNVNAATNKYKRLDSGTPDGSTSGAPYFTQCEMSVDSTRLIKNVSIAGGSSSMVVCVFGVTGLTADIAAPTISTSNVTSDGFTASWDSVPNAASYRLDVATDADFTNIVSGYNNKTVSGTSLKIQGLSSATTYYVRVRAANSAGAQSASSAYKCVKTYGKMTIIYNSNGGTGSMSNTTVAYNQSVPLSANQFTKVGYSFKNWNTQADGKGTSYVDQASVKNTDSTKNTTLTLYARWAAAGPVNLLNEGYAYGRDISTSSVTLAVDVNADDEVGSYQWQYAGEKNAAEDQWQDISDKIISEDHSNKFEIKSTNLKDGYWYRCVVNGQTKTIPVQLVKANGSTMTNVTRPYTYGQWYVSNGYVAYTSLNGKFDVLGKYEKNGTYYWLQTSYYGGWQMYTSASEAPETSSYYSNYNCSLDKLRVAFDSNDEFNMKFDALLANGQKSFAFGCDTMLGNWITSGSYSDYASLKSIKENDQIKQIQMVGAYSVDTAKATDTSFVLKYVDGFAPSYYWLGRYYNRQVWTNGTLEDVISTDSGMTSSWCNVADGNVKFEFHVGSVADAGAQITICATSEKDSITIKNPGSNCKYALYQVVNGKEELVSDWQKLSGASYTYPELEPNTKYIIKADKDGEIVTSEIYTKIDTSTGANSSVSGGKIKSGSTSSSITFTNLKNEYQYALTDSRGNVVKTYTSPNENEITFSGLKAGTTYYLIARSGENELCEKVSATTKKAVISFDANVDSGDVTGMPDSVAKVYGTAVKLPDATPVRANYQFAGWTTENYKNNQYVLYRAGSYYYGETDTTLYAVWYDASETIPTTETYTVQYDGNGNTAENVPASGTKKWGEPFTLSRMIPAAESYTFKEWNTKPDGSGTTYRPGDAYLLNKDVTLYAVWNVKQYQITVESNERYTAKVTGETVTEDGHVTYGKDAVITISANDGFDISQIKAQVNGIDITDGTLSEDKRSYTINLSDIKEDQYITVSGVNVNSIAVDESSYDFGELVEYYPSAPEAATITVTNDGEKITGAGGEEIPVTLQEQPTSDIENSAFIIGKVHDTILDSGSSATFTVQPKTGLKPGVYTENITVVTNTGARQVVKVTFEVKKDTVPPTGEISFADKKWNSLLNGITFGLFFNKTIEATISGQDEENGSGLDKIYYYIADQAMTQQDLDDMEEDQWTEGTTCSIAPNQKAVLYAKVTDRGGNVTYLSSDGVVLDDVAPEITGVEDDDELYIEKSYPIHVADANLDKVYVTEDREEATSDDEVETDDGTFTLKSEKEQSKTISAVDQAGNRSDAVTVHFVSLTALKDAAKDDIEKQAEKEKEKLGALEDLTPEEREQFEKEIDEKTAEQIEAIENAEDRKDVTQKEEKGKEELRKKLDDAVQKDLDNAKDTASKEIDKKADDAKKKIDSLTDLSDKEKEDAKKEIDQKAEDARNEISKVTDPASKGAVTVSKDAADQEIRKEQKKAEDTDLDHAKDKALDDLDQKAQDAKDAIDALEDLSEKEKEDARKEIDQKTEEAKKEIDKITDPANKNIVSENKDSADEEIRKEQEKAENTDLEHAKDKALDEIDQKAQDAKDAIDKLDDLTEQEKKDAKAEIDKKAEDAKKDIANVTDPAEKKNVSENKDSADQEIRKEQEKAAGKDLGNAKDTAVKEIDKKLEDALNAVDRLTNLSAAEKEKAKEEIKKQAEDAKNNIQDATEKSDVKNTKTEISADIVEKVDDAKKNDYDQTKDETANGVLTVVADSEKETAADKKYKVSLRLGNTEVEFKDSVAAGEKVSFDQIPDGIYNLVVSDGENQRTTYVKVTNGTATEVGKVSLSSQSTSVDVKLGAPDIAVAGLEKVYDTDVFKENEEAVKVIREGTGKVDVKLTADNVDQKDEMIENVVPEGKEINRYAELLADMIVTDAEGKTKNYNLRDIQQLVLIAMPLSEQEKNHTGYVLYRKHNDGTGEKVETLPMLSGEEQTAPTGEGFYMDRDYVYIWAQKFSVYALAYDAGSVAPTATPEVPTPTPVESTVTPVEPTETPEAPTPAETPSVTKAPSKIKDQSKLSGNEIDKLKLPLLLAQGKGGNKKISLSWTKLKKATGYECYWSYCDGKKFFRKFKATKDGKAAAVHKKLKNNRKYKYFVVAYQMVDGNKIYIAKSPQLHIAMKADKQTNVSKLMVNVTKVTLNKGKTFRTECRSTLENVKKKQVLHAKEYRYYTSDKKIAVVDKDGQIKATGNGNCTVTIIANNGVYRKISVTVSKTAKATRAKALVTDGAKFTDKATKAVYVITSLKNKTVALAGTEDVQLKDLETAVTVKYEGTVYRVTAIADNAFAGNKMLESVTLHKDIQSVGKAAFKNCKNLKKVTAYSVKWNKESLGTNAFQGISSKVHVYCMESVWEKYEALVEKANIPKGKMINLIDK